MQKCATLQDTVSFILKHHKEVRGLGGGCIAWKFLRRRDGTRIPIEESRGFKILQFHVTEDEDAITIQQFAAGFALDSKRVTMSSSLFLQDLMVINVYPDKAEFFSLASIDFIYLTKPHGSPVYLQKEIDGSKDVLLAQWCKDDDRVERLLEEISIGRRVMVAPPETRRYMTLDNLEF